MSGKIKSMIESIIEQRSKGNKTIAATTRTKIILKGIDPDHYTALSPDDPQIIEKIKSIALEFGIKLI